MFPQPGIPPMLFVREHRSRSLLADRAAAARPEGPPPMIRTSRTSGSCSRSSHSSLLGEWVGSLSSLGGSDSRSESSHPQALEGAESLVSSISRSRPSHSPLLVREEASFMSQLPQTLTVSNPWHRSLQSPLLEVDSCSLSKDILKRNGKDGSVEVFAMVTDNRSRDSQDVGKEADQKCHRRYILLESSDDSSGPLFLTLTCSIVSHPWIPMTLMSRCPDSVVTSRRWRRRTLMATGQQGMFTYIYYSQPDGS